MRRGEILKDGAPCSVVDRATDAASTGIEVPKCRRAVMCGELAEIYERLSS